MKTTQKLKRLKERQSLAQDELDNLHIFEPSEDWYKIRRMELEYKIASNEDRIFELEDIIKNARKRIIKKVLIGLGIVLSVIYFYCR
jgi:hypothetical protein